MSQAERLYQQWINQKHQILSTVLNELAHATSVALKLKDMFTDEELNQFEEFNSFIEALKQDYQVTDAPPELSPLTANQRTGKRSIQRNYKEDTPRCSFILPDGRQCSFPSAFRTTLCKKHTEKE